MNVKTKGIILSRRKYRENQKYLTILTADYGLLECKLRVFGQINRQQYNNIDVMGYYNFDLFLFKEQYVINAAEKIEDFYSLRLDVENLALGEYFCELMEYLKPDTKTAAGSLRLILNSLYFIHSQKRDVQLIKAIYEWRSLCIHGFMPDLIGCYLCGAYLSEKMYFLPYSGRLICYNCEKEGKGQEMILISAGTLQAMRFVAFKEEQEIFGFVLDAHSLKQFSKVSEEYMLIKTEKRFKTLEMYHHIAASEV